MTIVGWWRKRQLKKRTAQIARKSNEDGITARVDMVRMEALAEAAYDAMYEARLHGARDCYDKARFHYDRAVEAAQRAGLFEEASRLKRRRDHVARVYNSQFRYSSGS
jgi:hypothetical protein